jgi:cytosine deaminase
MLLHDPGDPALPTTEIHATEMKRHGLNPRRIANKARAVGTNAEPSGRRLARQARRAGLGIFTDPPTGTLRLPAFTMAELGVPVALGQDDIEDAYYPFGRNNMLEVAFLAVHALEAVSQPAMNRIYDMVTTVAADVLGVHGHRLETGRPADLVVLDGSSVREVLASHNPPRYVVAGGRLVAESTTTSTVHLE